MKSMTILSIVFLMLLSAVVTARAADQFSPDGIAAFASDPGLVLEDSDGGTTFFFDTAQNLVSCEDEGMVCRPVTVWGYAFNEQVAIDLGYRPVAAEENGAESFDDSLDLKRLTQNLMVGFSYKF